MCVLDCASADEILRQEGVDEAIRGRTLAQLSTSAAEESEAQAAWSAERSCNYLDGGILCYPRSIGGKDTVIVYSGPQDVFDRHRETLAALAGPRDGSAKGRPPR